MTRASETNFDVRGLDVKDLGTFFQILASTSGIDADNSVDLEAGLLSGAHLDCGGECQA